MTSTRSFVVLCLKLALCFNVTVAVNRLRICQHFLFVLDKDVVNDYALDGHMFQQHTVKAAAQCHVLCRDNCQCMSMNYLPTIKEHNCELNDENKDRKPDALIFKSNAQYYGLVRSYTTEGGQQHVPGKHQCVNRCCQSNPCLNGGGCQEICDPNDFRFNCTCPVGYHGKRCELRCYMSCQDALQDGSTNSGRYIICDGQTAPFYVYCDMESEPNYVWSLFQSFSFSQKEYFSNDSFGDDHPVKMDSLEVDWTGYRLSLSHMKHLATQSTHLRATCNFAAEGLQYTDYARSTLERQIIFSTFNMKCKWYEYLNVRGIECHNCTALTSQREGRPWFINSYSSKENGCQFDGKPGMGRREQNFGWYQGVKANPDHRCSSSPNSTTEHWFGIRKS